MPNICAVRQHALRTLPGKLAQFKIKENLKPPQEPTIHQDGKKPVSFQEYYMSIDEFCKRAIKTEHNNDDQCDGQFMTEDKDYPKPSVDLLASLVTLGKMIRDQKQLIRQEASQRAILTTNNTVTISAIMKKPIVSASVILSTDESLTTVERTILPQARQSFSHIEANPNKCDSLSSDIDASLPSSPSSHRIESLSSSDVCSTERSIIPNEVKDVDYWDRRKRNNVAARKSREDRRKKEIEVLKTTNELENENSHLTALLNHLTSRNEVLESRLQEIRAQGQSSASVRSLSL